MFQYAQVIPLLMTIFIFFQHSSRWHNIQKRYKLLGEDGLDGVTNSIPDKERNSVTGIVTNFITHVDKCTQSVIEKLEVGL